MKMLNHPSARRLRWGGLILLIATDVQAFVQPSLSLSRKTPIRNASVEDIDFGNIMEKIQADLPTFDDIPESVKSIEVASVDLTSLTESPSILAATALAILGLGAIAAAGGGSENGTSVGSSREVGSAKALSKQKVAEKKPDLSIPYDSAARLSYDAWCKANEKEYCVEGFAYYQELFNAKAVAEASAKKRARDLGSFQNQARPNTPPRRIELKQQEEPQMYFANEQR